MRALYNVCMVALSADYKQVLAIGCSRPDVLRGGSILPPTIRETRNNEAFGGMASNARARVERKVIRSRVSRRVGAASTVLCSFACTHEWRCVSLVHTELREHDRSQSFAESHFDPVVFVFANHTRDSGYQTRGAIRHTQGD